ncbi:MAG: hypothetical protein KC777_03265 [Cyanobacteria bacterium HKST-UBA02]|nr:hypothetical protein [Cyanobacteria bacterium HKST-UBA02]
MIESQSTLFKRFIAIEMHPAVYACLISVNLCIWLAYHCLNLSLGSSASPARSETSPVKAASRTTGTSQETEKASEKESSRVISAMSLPRMARAEDSPVLLSSGSASAASSDSIPVPEATPISRTASKLPATKGNSSQKNASQKNASRKHSSRNSSNHKDYSVGKNYLVPPPPPMAIFDHGQVFASAIPAHYQIDQGPDYSSYQPARHHSHYQPGRSRDAARFVTVDRYNRVVVSR